MRLNMRGRTRITTYAGVASVCAVVTFSAGGCVMRSTYDAALQEGMTAKAELAQAKDEHRGLARQVSDMEQRNAEVVREAEAAAEALRQANDEAERKRQQAEQEIAKLQQRVALATKQQRSLQYELTVARENASALQDLVDGFEKKVRDGDGIAPASSAPEPAVHKPFDPAAIPVPQDLPAAPAVIQQPAPAPAPTPAPMPAPATSRPKTVPPPQDDDWITSIKNWLMSVWHSVFS
jgi:hypothetical protein